MGSTNGNPLRAFPYSCGALVLLTVVLFLPALSPGDTFYYRDVSQNHVPFRQLTLQAIAEGDAPLWNPMRGAGQPLLANPNALILHPTTLLFFVLPFHWALKLSVILQVMLAATGCWLLVRDLGMKPRAAFLGAAIFSFSGFIVSLGSLLNLLDSAAFMPLTLWLAGRAALRGFAPWGSLAAASLAVQIFAGEPAILLATIAALGALHFSHAASSGSATNERPATARAAAMALILLIGGALSLVGILPAMELLAASERGAGFDPGASLEWSLHPLALLQSVASGVLGDPTWIDASHWWGGRWFDNGLPLVLSLYLGPMALLLAGYGVVAGWKSGGARRAEVVVLLTLVAVGVALALGRYFGPGALILKTLPGFSSVRYPVKFFLLVTWAVALLAARGDDARGASRMESRLSARRAVLIALLGALALFGIGLLVVAAADLRAVGLGADGSGAGRGVVMSLIHAALAAAAGLFLLRWRGRLAGPALVALCVADLLVAAFPLNPVAPTTFYDERPLLMDAAGEPSTNVRLWARPRPKGFAFRPPPGEEPGLLRPGFRWDRMTLRNATSFNRGYRFAYDRGTERLDIIPGAAIGQRLYEEEPAPLPPDQVTRLLSVASVGRVITYGDWRLPGWEEQGRLTGQSSVPVVVMRNPSALPRAYVVHRVEIFPDFAAASRRLRDPSFDPWQSVILEEGRAPDGTSVPEGLPRGVAIVEETPMKVRLKVDDGKEGYLVLTDTFYSGWEAQLDGAPALIARANAMFRAVAVPSGGHEVLFTYRPGSVRSGMIASLAALVLATLLAIPVTLRKR